MARKFDHGIQHFQGKLANLEEGRNRDIVTYVSRLQQISRNADKKDVDSLRECFYAFIRLSAECDMRIGNQAAYTAMGITSNTARLWRNGIHTDRAHQQLIEEVDQYCATYREITAASGEANTIWSIFAAKNYDGMTDTQQIVVAAHDITDDERTAAEISEKYEALPE